VLKKDLSDRITKRKWANILLFHSSRVSSI